MLDVDGVGDELEHRRAAHQGVLARGGAGRALLALLSRRRQRATLPWEELAAARRTGRVGDRGLARAQERRALLGARRDHVRCYERDEHLRGFAQITQDLSDRRHIQSLEQAARNVGEFIAVLAHELRNPLAPIRNAAQLMARLPRRPCVARRPCAR